MNSIDKKHLGTVVRDAGTWQTVEWPDGSRTTRRIIDNDDEEDEFDAKPRKWRREVVVWMANRILNMHGVHDAIVYASGSGSKFNFHSVAEWDFEESVWKVRFGMDATLFGETKLRSKVGVKLWPSFNRQNPDVDRIMYNMYAMVCKTLAPIVYFQARQRQRRINRKKIRELIRTHGEDKVAPRLVKMSKWKDLNPETFGVGTWLSNESQVNATITAIMHAHVPVIGELLRSIEGNDQSSKVVAAGTCTTCGKEHKMSAFNEQSARYLFPKRCWAKKCKGEVELLRIFTKRERTVNVAQRRR